MTRTEFLERYPFTIASRVEWADLDALQHVNNTVYFRYFERLRVAFFERVGMSAHRREGGFGPILHSTRCRFRAPLTYPDTIDVGAFISDVQPDRFLMQYGIYSGKLGALAADGDGMVVYYDYDRAVKAVMPEDLKARLAEFAQPPAR